MVSSQPEVDPYDERLWIRASSERRLRLAEREARAALGDLMDERVFTEPGDQIRSFRWQRERWARSMNGSLETMRRAVRADDRAA